MILSLIFVTTFRFIKRVVSKETVVLRRWGSQGCIQKFDVSSVSPSSERIDLIRSDEGLTLETSAFRIPIRWSIYIINSVDKTKFLFYKALILQGGI